MSLTKSRESFESGTAPFWLPSIVKQVDGEIRDAAIDLEGFTLVVPVFVPDVRAVRAFAEQLHRKAQPRRGIAFGWSAHYEPANDDVPEGSRAEVNPASFTLGDATAWCYTITWEADEPIEIVTDSLNH
jgi:hypothetical protein